MFWETMNESQYLRGLIVRGCLEKEGGALHGAHLCCSDCIVKEMERYLLMSAGCKSGVFERPKGFSNWAKLANIRLAQLQSGKDDVAHWATVLKQDNHLYDWMFNDKVSIWKRPILGYIFFQKACNVYKFQPDLSQVSIAFQLLEEYVVEDWEK